MDLMDINLMKLIKMYPRYERFEHVYNIFGQIINGLEYLHTKGIVHRDLKPSNIMLRFDENDDYIVVINDFGCAKKIQSHNDHDNLCVPSSEAIGTAIYVAPEIENMQHYSFASDIYSLGIILMEMLLDHYDNDIKEIDNIMLETLIKNMIHVDPLMRPTIYEIKKIWKSSNLENIFNIDK